MATAGVHFFVILALIASGCLGGQSPPESRHAGTDAVANGTGSSRNSESSASESSGARDREEDATVLVYRGRWKYERPCEPCYVLATVVTNTGTADLDVTTSRWSVVTTTGEIYRPLIADGPSELAPGADGNVGLLFDNVPAKTYLSRLRLGVGQDYAAADVPYLSMKCVQRRCEFRANPAFDGRVSRYEWRLDWGKETRSGNPMTYEYEECWSDQVVLEMLLRDGTTLDYTDLNDRFTAPC